MQKAITIFFFFLLFSAPLFSQQLPLTVYSNGHGPIQNGAREIFQDSKGWMWFVAGPSLIRYNGHRFTTIPAASGDTMQFCYNIFEMDNRVCVIANPYLLVVDGDSLRRHPSLPRNADIISVIDFKGKRYFSGGAGLYLFENSKATKLISHTSKGDNRNAVFRYNDSLLVGNFFRGAMFVFNIKRNTVHYYDCKSGKIQQDKKGNTFIHLLDKGIVQIQGIQLSGSNCTITERLLHPLPAKEAGYFIFDDNENIWAFSSHNWLKKISPSGEQSTYTEADGFPGFVFMDIYKDRENNIWLAHPNGVSKIADPGIKRYTVGEELPGNHIEEFFTTPDQKFILAAAKAGSSVFNGKDWKPLLYNHQSFHFYKTVMKNGKQYCVEDNILYETVIDFPAAQVKSQKKLAVFSADVLEIGADDKGALYITTQKGVYRYYQNRLLVFDSSKLGRSLLVDSRNRLWIGGWFDGLAGYTITYNNGEPVFKKIEYAKSAEEYKKKVGAIRGLCETREGNILAGTASNGLFHLSIKNDSIVQVAQFTVKDGLLSNTVRRIDTDGSGKWWFVTDNGVNSISSYSRIIKDEGGVYGITRVNTLLVNGNEVWISNYPGAVSLKTTRTTVPAAFKVFITGAGINNKPAPLLLNGGRKKLMAKEDHISFSFSVNSFINEKAMFYSYQLTSNGDTSWSEPAPEHTVNFSALRPGKYVFRVKASNNDGVWNEKGISLQIRSRRMPPHTPVPPPISAAANNGVWTASLVAHIAVLTALALVSLVLASRRIERLLCR